MKSTMEYFREISAIPRASGHEEKIADFICSTAEKNGLFYRRDSHNNVFVRKPASQDKQNMPSVLLAAHTDMVCEKTSESGHDFSSDPLTLVEKNGFVSALATTLGADNGGGVAVMLRLMEDGEASHQQTEFLFTSSEETGMQGAENFDYSLVSSDYIINLDSEKSATAKAGIPVLPSEAAPPTSSLVRFFPAFAERTNGLLMARTLFFSIKKVKSAIAASIAAEP